MEKIKKFLKRKDIEISLKRYGIDALGAMAQGLFCSLLIGTIINTLGTQFHIPFLTAVLPINHSILLQKHKSRSICFHSHRIAA